MIGADSFIDGLKPEQQSLHVEQRYARGVSDIDMWNFDVFLADVIVAGCDWYIENARSTPWNIEKGEWDAALREIRDGFASRTSSDAPDPPKRAWKLLRKHFKYFWD